MTDEQKQELLGYWKKQPYLKYYEALSLLTGSFPGKKVRFAEQEWVRERYELIKRILEDGIRKFELKVYFWETLSYDGANLYWYSAHKINLRCAKIDEAEVLL